MRLLIVLLCGLFASIAFAQEQTTSDGRPPIICPHGALANGLLCSGSYCDDITMRCSPNVRDVRRIFWTPFVHRAPGSGVAICSTEFGGTSGFVSGVACEGDWCDNVALQCTELDLFEPDFSSCFSSSWFSEEQDWQAPPTPFHFIVSMRCKDTHCDLKRMRSCRLKRREG
ncbi:hypothetical protein [uncultured Hoeflea sp.]|uniref:hypothetical protein n=1 Tax=uncultured Hoeflea sp. TaxID=538666 RepID=UPI00260E09DC|nr:hypothetical protein [uncultured Hoeflea sp.]